MKKLTTLSLFLMTFVSFPVLAADNGVLEFWECSLKDGKTTDDAARVNAKWLKLQNDANPDAGIRSWGLTSIVDQPGAFYWMDAFPTLEAWAKSRAVSETPAGQAIDEELNAIVECKSNTLYQATEH